MKSPTELIHQTWNDTTRVYSLKAATLKALDPYGHNSKSIKLIVVKNLKDFKKQEKKITERKMRC